MKTVIEHPESNFYPDQLKFYENRQFTKLYHKQIGIRQAKGITARQEESETFFDQQKVKQSNKENSQLGTFIPGRLGTSLAACRDNNKHGGRVTRMVNENSLRGIDQVLSFDP